jgi:PAS domain S-box-containing protein
MSQSKEPKARKREKARSSTRAAACFAKSLEPYVKAFYGSPVPVAIGRLRDGVFIEVNESFLRLFEYSRDQVIGRTSRELHIYDNPEDALACLHLLKDHQPVRNHELAARTGTGKPITLLFSGDTVTISGTDYVVGTAIDITDRKQAEEAEQTILQRFYTVLSNMYISILLATDEGRVEFVNQACCDYFSLNEPPEKVIGLQESEFESKVAHAFLDWQGLHTRHQEIIRRGQPVRGEETVMADGRTHLRDAIPIRVDGKSYGWLWYHTDVTELKRAEEKLRESGERFAKVFYRSPDVMTITHPADQRLIDANDSFFRLFEYSREEAIGRKIVDDLHIYINPRDRVEIMRSFQESGRAQSHEVLLRTKTGKVRVMLLSTELISFAGEDRLACTTMIDITERKQMEGELRKSRDEMEQRVHERPAELQESEETARRQLSEIESYYNMAPVGLAILDRQLRYVRANQRLAEMDGVPPHEHVGRTPREILPKEAADWFEEIAARVLESGRPARDMERVDDTALGVRRTMRMNLFPVNKPSGQCVGIGLIVEDITETKRIEEQLRQALKWRRSAHSRAALPMTSTICLPLLSVMWSLHWTTCTSRDPVETLRQYWGRQNGLGT